MSSLPRVMLLTALLAYFLALARGAEIAYCSPDNTGADTGYQAVYNQYQSDGSCQVNCQGSYAFAILQGPDCWCSNYAPSDQKQTNLCDEPCPGFQSDWCGSSAAGLYGYIALNAAPSGTIGGPPSNTQTFASIASSPAPPSTLITYPSSTAIPTPSPSSTPDPSTSIPAQTTSPLATQAITSITTVTGQVRTIIITPSATADPTLGQGSVSSNGISKGTVVGIVIGVALGIGLLIGLIVWFCLKRKHNNGSIASAPPFGVAYGSNEPSNPSHSGVPSRQVSQMSSAGLLVGKGPRIQTTGHGMSSGPRSPETASGFSNDRRSIGTDQRLNPYALYAHDEARQSNLSLQDNQDYSRQLRVANPDP